MDKRMYYLPESYQIDRFYYYRNGSRGEPRRYLRVRLVAYRPHPAELVVEINGKKRLIRRRDLYMRAA